MLLTNPMFDDKIFYLWVACACKSVLDRVWRVSVLLIAEGPLAVGIA